MIVQIDITDASEVTADIDDKHVTVTTGTRAQTMSPQRLGVSTQAEALVVLQRLVAAALEEQQIETDDDAHGVAELHALARAGSFELAGAVYRNPGGQLFVALIDDDGTNDFRPYTPPGPP